MFINILCCAFIPLTKRTTGLFCFFLISIVWQWYTSPDYIQRKQNYAIFCVWLLYKLWTVSTTSIWNVSTGFRSASHHESQQLFGCTCMSITPARSESTVPNSHAVQTHRLSVTVRETWLLLNLCLPYCIHTNNTWHLATTVLSSIDIPCNTKYYTFLELTSCTVFNSYFSNKCLPSPIAPMLFDRLISNQYPVELLHCSNKTLLFLLDYSACSIL